MVYTIYKNVDLGDGLFLLNPNKNILGCMAPDYENRWPSHPKPSGSAAHFEGSSFPWTPEGWGGRPRRCPPILMLRWPWDPGSEMSDVKSMDFPGKMIYNLYWVCHLYDIYIHLLGGKCCFKVCFPAVAPPPNSVLTVASWISAWSTQQKIEATRQKQKNMSKRTNQHLQTLISHHVSCQAHWYINVYHTSSIL